MNENAFSSLALSPPQLESLSAVGYKVMTPIQAQALPHILSGKDVIAQSKTGSGKTAAFGLGLLEKLEPKRFQVQALVLCPTRELAEQVSTEIRALARGMQNIKLLTLCGGKPLRPQAESLEHGAHIVVGTPGRIEDHLGKGSLKLDTVNTFVLDEADRMLEMGFQSAIDAITEHVPKQRQTLLFSATYPGQIKSMAKRMMREPVIVKVDHEHDESSIEQHFYKVKDDAEREMAIRLLLLHFQPACTLIFCNTKNETQHLAKTLRSYDFNALPIHGDLEQKDRDQTLVQFANRSISILVATDVAARGLDIDSIDAVINYQIAHDPEVHIHRIGRTGRAGARGAAYTLYNQAEKRKLSLIADNLPTKLQDESLPSSSVLYSKAPWPPNRTLQIDGGKKQKVRAGDILGALTAGDEITGAQVGKIDLTDNWAFVAVNRDIADHAFKKLRDGKLKGRSFRVRFIGH